jgi:hypothetical protein
VNEVSGNSDTFGENFANFSQIVASKGFVRAEFALTLDPPRFGSYHRKKVVPAGLLLRSVGD